MGDRGRDRGGGEPGEKEAPAWSNDRDPACGVFVPIHVTHRQTCDAKLARRRERAPHHPMLSCDKLPPNWRVPMTPRSTRHRPAVIFAMLAAGASANPARADDIVLKDAESMAGAVMWLSSGAPGLVLAVVRGEEAVVLGGGEAPPGSQGGAVRPFPLPLG